MYANSRNSVQHYITVILNSYNYRNDKHLYVVKNSVTVFYDIW